MHQNLKREQRDRETVLVRDRQVMPSVVFSSPVQGKHQALQDFQLCSSGCHSPSLIYRIKSGIFSCANTPTPKTSMEPMLPLEPCYSAAHFKGRPSSSISENICSDRSSRNNSAWGFFTVFPLGQLQYSTGASAL